MHMKSSTLRAEEPPSLGAAYGPDFRIEKGAIKESLSIRVE